MRQPRCVGWPCFGSTVCHGWPGGVEDRKRMKKSETMKFSKNAHGSVGFVITLSFHSCDTLSGIAWYNLGGPTYDNLCVIYNVFARYGGVAGMK